MYHEHNHFEMHKALHDKMSKIYIYQAMLTFAKSMIGIFVPVYLYKLGYSLIEILLYSVSHSLIYLILIPISTMTIKNIGFKYTILLTTPIYILHILSLNYITLSPIIFHLSWITFGFYVAFFWPAMHSEIALNSSSKHRGSQIGTLQIISTIFGTIAPFIGGYLLETSSYYYLLILATIIILAGSIPLMLAKDIKIKKYEFKFSDFIRLTKNKKFKKSKIAFAAEGVEWTLTVVIWPILLFILLNENFLNLGLLLTFVSIISVLIVLYLKDYIDKKNKNKILNLITKFISLNWFLRSIILLIGSFFLYFIETFSKLIKQLFSLSFMSIFYNNANKSGYMDYIILREIYLHGIRIFAYIFIFFPFLLIYGENLITISSIIFIGVFFALGLSYLKEE